MIIQSGSVAMKSKHSYESKTEILQSTVYNRIRSASGTQKGGLFGNATLHFDSEGQNQKQANSQQAQEDVQNRFLQSQNIKGLEVKDALESFKKAQEETLKYLMRLFFGKEYDTKTAPGQNNVNMGTSITSGVTNTTTYFEEKESTSFSTTGTVITSDGRKLSFSVDVEMSRSFTQYTQTSEAFQFCDPLVINLDTNAADISDQKFYFDLDADGHEELISSLGSGSGFLALDKNNDGKINNGNELFGVKSGDGFQDLARYDSDGNGWIDEADEIFDKLVIWTKDSSGKDVLCGLGKAGIGAIYLGNVNTEFTIKSGADKSTSAAIRKSGLYLYENGTAGTIQHVDFAN